MEFSRVDLMRGAGAWEGAGSAPRSEWLAVDEGGSGLACVATAAGLVMYDVVVAPRREELEGGGGVASRYVGSVSLRDAHGAPAVPLAVDFGASWASPEVGASGARTLPSLVVLAEGAGGQDEVLVFDLVQTLVREADGGVGRARVHAVLSARCSLPAPAERGRLCRRVLADAAASGAEDAVETQLARGARGDFATIRARGHVYAVANGMPAGFLVRRGARDSLQVRPLAREGAGGRGAEGASVLCACQSADGRWVLVGNSDGTAQVWGVAAGGDVPEDAVGGEEAKTAQLVREVRGSSAVTAAALVRVPRHACAAQWEGGEEVAGLGVDLALGEWLAVLGHARGEVSMWWLAPRCDVVPSDQVGWRTRQVPTAAYPCMHSSMSHIASVASFSTPSDESVRVAVSASGLVGLRVFELSRVRLAAEEEAALAAAAPSEAERRRGTRRSVRAFDARGHRVARPAPPPNVAPLLRPAVAFPSYRRCLSSPPLGGASPADAPRKAEAGACVRGSQPLGLRCAPLPPAPRPPALFFLTDAGLHVFFAHTSSPPTPPVGSAASAASAEGEDAAPPPLAPRDAQDEAGAADFLAHKLRLPTPLRSGDGGARDDRGGREARPRRATAAPAGPAVEAVVGELVGKVEDLGRRVDRLREQTHAIRHAMQAFSAHALGELASLAKRLQRHPETQQPSAHSQAPHVPRSRDDDFWAEEDL